MKILVCDRCGFELTERDDVNVVLEGAEAWKSSVKEKGGEPRGLYPCKYHRNCAGEMVLQNKKRNLFGKRSKAPRE